MFTFDDDLTDEFFEEFREVNVQFVTTKSRKEEYYVNNEEVITLEELLSLCVEKDNYWRNYRYKNREKQEIKELLQKSIKKVQNFELLRNFYEQKIEELKGYKTLSEISESFQ